MNEKLPVGFREHGLRGGTAMSGPVAAMKDGGVGRRHDRAETSRRAPDGQY